MTEKLSNLSRVLFDKATGEFLVGNDNPSGFSNLAIQRFPFASPFTTSGSIGNIYPAPITRIYGAVGSQGS